MTGQGGGTVHSLEDGVEPVLKNVEVESRVHTSYQLETAHKK